MTPLSIDKGRGRFALLVGHCAGLVDLVGLPLWVGQLIAHYKFNPQEAGGLATLFLAGIVITSALLAPRFHRLSGRVVATLGFAISSIGFFVASTIQDSLLLTVLHAICGLATGAGLSMTHGTISQGENPHRLIAMAGVALGTFAVVFMGIVPKIIAAHGGPVIFIVFGIVMAFASLVALTSFPTKAVVAQAHEHEKLAATPDLKHIRPAIWFGLAGFGFACLQHGLIFSFVERIGSDYGFSMDQIGLALLVMAIASIFLGILAGWLEHRLPARGVLFFAPILHALSVVILVNAVHYPAYAIGVLLLPGMMVFMNTFSFSALAKLDSSGRSLAAFPAATMIGSALGPVVGGTLVKSSGSYGQLGVGALVVCIVIALCFWQLTKKPI